MREEDERARLDKAEQKGKEESENNIILEMHKEGMSIENIVKFTKVTTAKVEQIINQEKKNKK
jgi:hypothetical protein